MSRRVKTHGLYVGLWIAIWFLFFATLLLGWARLPHSDFSGQFYAYAQFQAREMWSGSWPLWSSGSFGGVPFVADPQAAVFYLPRWLTILLGGADLSYFALELEALLHLWVMGLGLYFFVFAILNDAGPPTTHHPSPTTHWAALLSAVTFTLGGYMTSYPLLQLAIVETWTWVPWALLLLRWGVVNGKNSRPLWGSALLMGLAITAGHPQTALHAGYVWGGYFVFLALRAGWGWRTFIARGGMMAVLALGASAVAWLPVVRYWPTTVRLEAGYDFVATGQQLTTYFQALVPGAITKWSPGYIGILSLILALSAWFGRRLWRPLTAEIHFWAGTAVLALWLSLGDKGILFALWYRIAPGFQLFRQQERLVGVVVLAASILAGLGLWLLLNRTSWAGERHRSFGRALAVVGGGLLLAAVFFLVADHVAVEGWGWRWGVGVVVWVIGGGCWVLGRSRVLGVFGVLVVVVSAGNLYWATRPGLNLEAIAPDPFWVEPGWLDEVTAGDGRFDPGFLYFANVGEALGLESVRGISPLKPRQLAELERLPLSKSWPLLAVSHGLFVGEPPADLDVTVVDTAETSIIPGERLDGAVLVANNQPVARAAMRYEVAVALDEATLFNAMAGDGFDPARQVALTAEVAALYTVEPPAVPPVVEVIGDRSWRVETQTAGYLTLSDWFLPGQTVWVNGEKADPLPANLGLMAVWLPAGQYEVEVGFRPAVVGWGALVTLLSLTVAFGLMWLNVTSADDVKQKQLSPQPSLFSPPFSLFPIPFSLPPITYRLTPTTHKRLLFTLLFLAFAVRLVGLDAQELRGDESFSYLFANKPLAQVVPDLIDEADPHPPLHYLLLSGWIKLAGVSELALRLPSLAAGILTLPLLYLIGRRLWGKTAGLVVLVLAALSPSLIWLAQDVRNQYTFAMLLTTAATWQLLHLRQRPGRWRAWAWYALWAALAMYSHYYAIFALLSHGLYLLKSGQKDLLGRWVLSGLVAVVAFAPWLWVMVFRLAAKQLSDPSTPQLSLYLTQIFTELSFGRSFGADWIRWGVLGLLLIAIIGWRGWGSRAPADGVVWMLGMWLVLAAGGIFLILFRRSTFNAFYIAVAAPAWLLLITAGLRTLWRRGGWEAWGALLVLGGWLLGMGVSIVNQRVDPAFSKSWGYRETAARLAAEVEPGDVFIAHFPDPNFDYYFRDIDLPRTIAPPRPGTTAEETAAYLADLADRYKRLWFIPAHRSGWDPEDVAYEWLEFQTLREAAARFNRLELLAYRPQDDLAAVITVIDEPLGDLVLHGVYLTIDGEPADPAEPLTLSGEQQLEVTVIWEAADALATSYTMFVHVLAPDGRLIAQHDGIPLRGTRPTTLWQAGERVLDPHELVVPAGGGFDGATIVVGAYETETVERLRFEGGGDAWTVARVGKRE